MDKNLQQDRLFHRMEMAIILLFACIPLLVRFPYRVNIFISWEGAYRMSLGELPFRDFGTPIGGFYWVMPAIFFKLFGPAMVNLVKAQVVLNIISGLSFCSILRSLGVFRGIRLVSVLLFCISYSFFNFWPWYNHSVIVYELAGLACICRYAVVSGFLEDVSGHWTKGILWLAGGAVLLVCSVLTKQDAGAMGFCVGLALTGAISIYRRDPRPLAVFGASYVIALSAFILPLLRFGFGYWFNHGQAPHTARLSFRDVTDEFFGASQWLKFYLFLIVLLLVLKYRSASEFFGNRKGVLFCLLTLGILGEATIFQVTSYTPPDNNIFFHSFAFPFLLTLLASWSGANRFKGRTYMTIGVAGVLIWWSCNWWKYAERITDRFLPHATNKSMAGGENIVNKETYMIPLDTMKEAPMDQWVECGLPSFRKIYMPPGTAAGIHRLMDMDLVRNGHGQLQVLNMSELTPLAADMPYRTEKNGRLPLWYHLGVGMFNRQADTFETRIGAHYYDLVLFEHIPGLNNFFPFRVRDSLRMHYVQVDSFPAPRRGLETRGTIEVFVRPSEGPSSNGSSLSPSR